MLRTQELRHVKQFRIFFFFGAWEVSCVKSYSTWSNHIFSVHERYRAVNSYSMGHYFSNKNERKHTKKGIIFQSTNSKQAWLLMDHRKDEWKQFMNGGGNQTWSWSRSFQYGICHITTKKQSISVVITIHEKMHLFTLAYFHFYFFFSHSLDCSTT